MGIVQSRGSDVVDTSAISRELVGSNVKGNNSTSLHPLGQQMHHPNFAGPHARSGSVRGPPRQPMPDTLELERRFTKVLVSFFY